MSKKHKEKEKNENPQSAELPQATTEPVTPEVTEVIEPGEQTPAEVPATDWQAEAAKYKDLAMRTAAEFDNFRKRAALDKENSIRYANTSLIEKLLPVLDSFEEGMKAARTATNVSAVLEGLEMVKKQLSDFLLDQGVEIIDATDAVFDPHLHEAFGAEASESVPADKVIRQIRKGYKLKGRLVRPASVFVSKGKE